MTSVEEHLRRVLGLVGPLPGCALPLLQAHGCVLAEDVVAQNALPSFANSAMDGYAVRLSDLQQLPVTLPVIADLAAGPSSPLSLPAGTAARIMTGAAVPEATEAVVPVECTDAGVHQVRIEAAPAPGQHVRRVGEDVAAGEVVLACGDYLGSAQIGLAAAVGRASLLVRPRPRVVVISTGSELVEPGASLSPGMIPDSNSYALTAAAVEAGAQARRVGIVSDDPQTLLAGLHAQLAATDLIITSGGVSVGAHDVVKAVLSELGTVHFDKVTMQPGMPQGFGTIGPEGTPILTLPGNPVSALVSFEVFVRPALRTMLGALPVQRPIVSARSLAELRSPQGKTSFLRVRVQQGQGGWVARPVSGPGSHLLAGMSRANALAVLAPEITSVAAGEDVTVMILEDSRR